MKLALLVLALAPLPFLAGGTPEKAPFAPLDYFAAHCERCHGPNGEFYGENFAKNQTDEQLRQIVKAMAEGPGDAPLDDKSLDVLTAFHLSLRDQKPFLYLIERETDGDFVNLSGEPTPEAQLRFENQLVALEGHRWQLRLPQTTDWKTAQLIAEKDGKRAVLKLE